MGGSHSSGGTFPSGSLTSVSYTANDIAGNIATCDFTIAISDDEVPVITNCPADIEACGSVAFWIPPLASDNCNISDFSRNTATGGFLNPNVNTIIYTAIDDDGNSSVCTFDVTVNDLPNADAGLDQAVNTGGFTNVGGTPTASGGTPPYTYQWFDLGVGPPFGFSVDINPLVLPDASRIYKVYVFDNNQCAATDQMNMTVNAPASPLIDENKSDLLAQIKSFSLEIYPNPTNGYFELSLTGHNESSTFFRVSISDLIGNEIQRIEGDLKNDFSHTFDLSSYSSGQYVIAAHTESQVVYKKLMLFKELKE
jgi:hypothetical protein